jgi:hypothetical protein
MRKVKVYSTVSGLRQFDSSATIWGELKYELQNEGYSFSNMTVTENKRNSTLMLDEAELPEEDFVLMLTPQKTKSGAMSYGEIRAQIKEAFMSYGTAAATHFNEGKNYTNKSKDELEFLLNSWLKKIPTSKQVVLPKAEVSPAPIKVDTSYTEDLEDDEDDYEDNEEDEDSDEVAEVIEAISNLNWNGRYDDFNLAIALIRGEKSAKNLTSYNVASVKITTSEEDAWIAKMRNKGL